MTRKTKTDADVKPKNEDEEISFYRGKQMRKYELALTRDNAFDCMVKLGELGKVQFCDMSKEEDEEGSNLYVPEVLLCNQLKEKVLAIESYMVANDYPIKYYPNVDTEHVPTEQDLRNLEMEISSADEEMKSFMRYDVDLHQKKQNYEEHAEVLDFVESELRGVDSVGAFPNWAENNGNPNDGSSKGEGEAKVYFFAGTIPNEWFLGFDRMLRRVTNGSHTIKDNQIETRVYNPMGDDSIVYKKVFLIGTFGEKIAQKVYKVVTGYHATLYEVPDTSIGRINEKSKLQTEIKNISYVLQLNKKQRKSIVEIVQNNLYIWKIKLRKMMQVYTELNKFSLYTGGGSKYLQRYCWLPAAWEKEVRASLLQGALKSVPGKDETVVPGPILTNVNPRSDDKKPTHFDLNGFTKVFQNLIDSYGVANYHELNPAPYTIITFPFLFSVMFGDIGHGLIMASFGLALIRYNDKYNESNRKKLSVSEISNIIFGGRYIIFLMGLFSMYTGLVYNDCFSKPLNIFGSRWRVSFTEKEILHLKDKATLDPTTSKNYLGDPYYFGFDPIWKVAGDESIVTFNSIKMKLAIILGVFHMLFGLVLAAINNVHFGNFANLALITIPQIMIFSALFAYLVFMVFYKWTHFGGHNKNPYTAPCAPSILITFIDMFLMKDAKSPKPGCEKYMYPGQRIVQMILICIALICIPILLIGKPLFLCVQEKRIHKTKSRDEKKQRLDKFAVDIRQSLIYQLESEPQKQQLGRLSRFEPQEPEHDRLEIWIHSAIHAIDSVLGAISHTASYLRLWALSLAHEQLSAVLWDMVFQHGFTCSYGFFCSFSVFFVFTIWGLLTVSILVTMEGLSAFLHCLRLHWVEFQSKFYTGAGEIFSPFSFGKAQMRN